jgi:NAD(P)-dependent dehydrogenase (short-subunit alcohol dehydrogenase family)
MYQEMEGGVSLVTGAGSGIGRAVAMLFAREETKVVVADVNDQGGEETVRMIRDAGGEARFIRTDVSDPTGVEALVRAAVETYGRLDYACNNAGILGEIALTADCTHENWNRVTQINLSGARACMKYELQQMLKQKSGAIVNMTSVAGLEGAPGLSPYAAAKAGLMALTKSAASEYFAAGIRINAVCPGSTRTPMGYEGIKSFPGSEAEFMARLRLKRMAEPEEVAETVIWLCSNGASFVVGQEIRIG